MPPTISCQKSRPTGRGVPSLSLSVTRQSHHSTSRHISLAHKRRFRYRQFLDSLPTAVSAFVVSDPPLLSTPTVDPHPSVFPSSDTLVTSTSGSYDPTRTDLTSLQLQAARGHVMVVTAALIAVCVLVGLTACTVIARVAYRKRSSLLQCLQRHRQVEDDLGFVFIEYDDSTWGIPSKEVWREIPWFENDTRETETGEVHAHARLITPCPVTPMVRMSSIPTIPPRAAKAFPGTRRSMPCRALTATEKSLCRRSDAIAETDGQHPGHMVSTVRFDPYQETHRLDTNGNTEMLNALGLATERDDNIEVSMFASPQLAAALALRAGEVDDATEETEFTVVDLHASDSVGCGLSTKSGGSKEDYESQGPKSHSMDFERGIAVSLGTLPDTDYDNDQKSPLDLYNLPRVVISASPSVASEVFSSSPSNCASGKSEVTIDLGDFPRPPFICDALTNTSTSLISEIELQHMTIYDRNDSWATYVQRVKIAA
ncbi:hypothetical protein F5148DRAFT_1377246 [Russula earlei]|uniref:Uncharacterized protein n=1 Tax=Russula earlei TaxID=71964 RepID=A0ACC0U5D9_9AGAM|nr:hypothetical protein F5148DRAFT_1377246 [Russula earlei]